jgi:hypothetical protein
MSDRPFLSLPMTGESQIGRSIGVEDGSYLVYATVDALEQGSQITCAIFAGDTVLQNGHLNVVPGTEGQGEPSLLGTIAMSGAYAGAATTLRLDCAAAPDTGSTSQTAQINWVSLNAVKVGALNQS